MDLFDFVLQTRQLADVICDILAAVVLCIFFF